jgi:hypothetical protein
VRRARPVASPCSLLDLDDAQQRELIVVYDLNKLVGWNDTCMALICSHLLIFIIKTKDDR